MCDMRADLKSLLHEIFSVLRQFNLQNNLQLKVTLNHNIVFTSPVLLPMNLQYLYHLKQQTILLIN